MCMYITICMLLVSGYFVGSDRSSLFKLYQIQDSRKLYYLKIRNLGLALDRTFLIMIDNAGDELCVRYINIMFVFVVQLQLLCSYRRCARVPECFA